MDYLITNRQEAEHAEREAKRDIEAAERGIESAVDGTSRLAFEDEKSAAESRLHKARAALLDYPEDA